MLRFSLDMEGPMRSVLVAVLMIAGMTVGCGGDQPPAANNSPTPTPTPTPTPSAQAVQAGVPFKIGQHEFTDWAPWSTSLEVTNVAGKIINRGNAASAASFQLKFLNGSTVMARFTCSSGNLQPGKSEQIQCALDMAIGVNPPREPPYDRITAEATF